MTSRQSARLAGFLFLAYIATGLTQMALGPSLPPLETAPPELLAQVTAQAARWRMDALLTLLTGFEAVFLGGALYALTRSVDEELALLALLCRVTEGVLNAAGAVHGASRIGLAATIAAAAGTPGADRSALLTAGGLLLRDGGGTMVISATCFAVGSTIFAWLLLRGRLVPAWLARLGVVASVLVAVLVPARWFGLEGTWVMILTWLPMLVFEVALGIRLIARGVATPGPDHAVG